MSSSENPAPVHEASFSLDFRLYLSLTQIQHMVQSLQHNTRLSLSPNSKLPSSEEICLQGNFSLKASDLQKILPDLSQKIQQPLQFSDKNERWLETATHLSLQDLPPFSEKENAPPSSSKIIPKSLSEISISPEDIMAVETLKAILQNKDKKVDLDSTVTISIGELQELFGEDIVKNMGKTPASVETMPISEELSKTPEVLEQKTLVEEKKEKVEVTEEERKLSTAETVVVPLPMLETELNEARKHGTYVPPKEFKTPKALKQEEGIVSAAKVSINEGASRLETLKVALEKTGEKTNLSSTINISIQDLKKFYEQQQQIKENKKGPFEDLSK